MSSAINVLMIGGEADGRLIAVPDDMRTVTVVIAPPEQTTPRSVFIHAEYRIGTLQDDDGTQYYVGTMSGDVHPLKKLLAFYAAGGRPKKPGCQAVQHSDQMVCRKCELAWDMNDPNRPDCRQ